TADIVSNEALGAVEVDRRWVGEALDTPNLRGAEESGREPFMPLRFGLTSRSAAMPVSWALLLVSVVGIVTAGCAGASQGRSNGEVVTGAKGVKRIVAAMNGEPNSLVARMNSA